MQGEELSMGWFSPLLSWKDAYSRHGSVQLGDTPRSPSKLWSPLSNQSTPICHQNAVPSQACLHFKAHTLGSQNHRSHFLHSMKRYLTKMTFVGKLSSLSCETPVMDSYTSGFSPLRPSAPSRSVLLRSWPASWVFCTDPAPTHVGCSCCMEKASKAGCRRAFKAVASVGQCL